MKDLFFNSWMEWCRLIKKERKETNYLNQKAPWNQDCLPFLCVGKEIKLVNPKGNQPWIFIGRTDAEAEASILGPSDAKSQLIGKDPDARKNWGQEEKKATEDEIVGWHHWLNERAFEHTLEDNEGQGGLACSVHGVAKSSTWLSDWTELFGWVWKDANEDTLSVLWMLSSQNLWPTSTLLAEQDLTSGVYSESAHSRVWPVGRSQKV